MELSMDHPSLGRRVSTQRTCGVSRHVDDTLARNGGLAVRAGVWL